MGTHAEFDSGNLLMGMMDQTENAFPGHLDDGLFQTCALWRSVTVGFSPKEIHLFESMISSRSLD